MRKKNNLPKERHATFAELTARQKVQYIWDYYKLPIFAVMTDFPVRFARSTTRLWLSEMIGTRFLTEVDQVTDAPLLLPVRRST